MCFIHSPQLHDCWHCTTLRQIAGLVRANNVHVMTHYHGKSVCYWSLLAAICWKTLQILENVEKCRKTLKKIKKCQIYLLTFLGKALTSLVWLPESLQSWCRFCWWLEDRHQNFCSQWLIGVPATFNHKFFLQIYSGTNAGGGRTEGHTKVCT